MDYIEHICHSGGEVYVVGGAVRNYLHNYFHSTNIPIKDYDFLVRLLDQNALISVLKKVGSIKEVGQAFGIVLFTPNASSEPIEFALPRTEESTGSGYRDFIVTADHTLSLFEDFSRRDATINAIAIRVRSLEDLKKLSKESAYDSTLFIDPYNGVSDIKNKIWRCVGDPNKRFIEDPNRIMRAFRQSAELDLDIEIETLKAIKQDYSVMQALVPQSYVRLYNEFLKMISSKNSRSIENLKIMCEIGILDFLGISNVKTDFSCDLTLILKFATLICSHTMEENIKEWVHLRQISATNYFLPTDMNILISIQKFHGDVVKINSKYSGLKVVEQIYKLFKMQCYDILNNIITYIQENELIDDTTYELIKNSITDIKSYIPSTDQLTLNGNILMSKWNVKGKDIKDTKERLLDLIFRDEAVNEISSLESHLQNNK